MTLWIAAPLLVMAGLAAGIPVGMALTWYVRRRAIRAVIVQQTEHPHAHILRAQSMAVAEDGSLITQ